MIKGDKVLVMSKGKVLHEGEYLGLDPLGSHKVGLTKTSIPGVVLVPGKKYISVFYAKLSQLVLNK